MNTRDEFGEGDHAEYATRSLLCLHGKEASNESAAKLGQAQKQMQTNTRRHSPTDARDRRVATTRHTLSAWPMTPDRRDEIPSAGFRAKSDVGLRRPCVCAGRINMFPSGRHVSTATLPRSITTEGGLLMCLLFSHSFLLGGRVRKKSPNRVTQPSREACRGPVNLHDIPHA